MLHSSPVPSVPLDKPPKEEPVVHGLNVSPEELESLRQAFRIFDVKGTGSITLTDFAKIIENLNIATDPSEISSITNAVDLNNDNLIDFEEFATAMIRHLTPEEHQSSAPTYTEEPQSYAAIDVAKVTNGRRRGKRISFYDDLELVQCFQAFDKNRDGLISQQELETVMLSLGERLTRRDIKEMMDEADTNGDGFIDFEEFKQLLPK